jgi:predicted nucleic acid-binding protein
MIFADTNLFIDVLEKDARWFEWSVDALARARAAKTLVTGPIVLAELVRYAGSPAELEALPAAFGARIVPWSLDASFCAGTAYARYRAAGGGRETILADLLIGGHAVALGATILTRDPRRFRAYFADLPIIAPGNDHG